MKNVIKNSFIVSIVLLLGATLNSCRDKSYEELTYTANVPIYMGFDQFRASVKKTPARDLKKPGKIYFKDNYLYINENQEGIHVINNTNPSSPIKVAFIEIPGNVDIAIRNNILYADSYIDLVAIDITNPLNPAEIDRVPNAFPNVLPSFNQDYPIYGLDFTKGVVVGWENRVVTEVIEIGSGYRGNKLYFDASGVPTVGSGEVGIVRSTTGIGGSMARFTIHQERMYAIHNNAIKIFNIGTTPGITKGNEIKLQRVVETIFPYDNKLFLGTTTGMLVYGLTNPASPNFISTFEHINSCDPVVVQGNTAYVTLRSGTRCNGFTNQLDVINIANIANPVLIKSYSMTNPHGLGIDNNILFICDGDAGLKVYNAANPLQIAANMIAHFPNIKTFDVIPYNGVLMLIGADGFYQYDYTNINNLVLLSQIPVVRP